MNKNLKNAAKSLLGILSAFLLVSVMAACAPKTTLAGDWADDGTFTVTADTARDDDMFMIGYEVEDGTTALTITPDLSKGTLHIALAAPLEVDASTEGEGADATVDDLIASTSFDFESGDNIFVVDAQGQGATTIEVEPGYYTLVVAGDNADPATGTVAITPVK